MGDKWNKILQRDIALCEEAISKDDEEDLWDLYKYLYPKYLKVIDGLNYGTLDKKEYSLRNIRFILGKLEMQTAIIEQQETYDSLKQNKISINNSNTNTNSNSISINISFDETRKEIENMTSLTDAEIDEALTKVDELEQIVNSEERKSRKWEKAKDIIKWIADKGVDVGISLLPLLLKIQQ